MGKLFLDWWNN